MTCPYRKERYGHVPFAGITSMFYGFFFIGLAALLVNVAVQTAGWGSLILIWPALAFLFISVAYLGAGAKLLGKRPDGTISRSRQVLLLPYFVLIGGLWHLVRWLSREPVVHEVAPGIRIGRRLLAHEVPKDLQTVVDLTSEFAEPHPLRCTANYISVPVLDGMPGTSKEFLAAAQRVAELPKPVFIHCAQGHGRTAMFTALLLIATGYSKDVEDALSQIRSVRPGARPNSRQRRFLELAKSVDHR